MVHVNFYELGSIDDCLLLFAVIMAKHKGKWIYVKHKERSTWEIPGGHREEHEELKDTASRELIEETGSKEFKIHPVCIYSVEQNNIETFGQLFFAEVYQLEELPESEIGVVAFFDTIPENLTYPLIQAHLAKKIEKIFQ